MRFYSTFGASSIIALVILLNQRVSAQLNKPTNINNVPSPTGMVKETPSGYSANTILNFTRTQTALGPISNEADFLNANFSDVQQETKYSDGLGRNLQTVLREFSPGDNPHDFVTTFMYDKFGHETYKYLPFISTSGTGDFKQNAFGEQASFLHAMFNGEQVLYSRAVFEQSPLNRVQATFAAGNSWAGTEGSNEEHGTHHKFLFNLESDNVKKWQIESNDLSFNSSSNWDIATNIPFTNGSYNPGTLYKDVIEDEHGNATVEFRDIEGKLILKKVQIGATAPNNYNGYVDFLCTYYVYDDLNRLRFVIPPKVVSLLITTDVNWTLNSADLCYRYEYDERNRMVAKKEPDADWNYMLYDSRDRLVYTQDGKMRLLGQWMTTLYDQINRPIISGLILYSGSRNQLKLFLEGVNPEIVGTQTFNGSYSKSVNGTIVLNSPQDGLQQAAQSITLENGFSTTGDFTAEIVNSDLPGDPFWTDYHVAGNPIPQGTQFIPLILKYYDNYEWADFPDAYSKEYYDKLESGGNSHVVDMPTHAEFSPKGLPTITRTRVLENPNMWNVANSGSATSGNWIKSIVYYDDRDRVIQARSVNYKAGIDIVTNMYNFSNKIVSSYAVHDNPSGGIHLGVKTNMVYDQSGRLLKISKSVYTHALDSYAALTTTLSEYRYNALGQLSTKTIGQKRDEYDAYTAIPIETLDYEYNIRGMLKGINKDYANKSGAHADDRFFGVELSYDWGFSNKQYNGNIAGFKWRSKGDGEQRAYGFKYDNTNRLLTADFSQFDNGVYGDNVNNMNFDVQMGNGTDPMTAYDENGNIKAMKQWGLKGSSSQLIDDLQYEYGLRSNKLINVQENLSAGTGGTNSQIVDNKLGDFTDRHLKDLNSVDGSQNDYVYDANGNLINDLNKNISTWSAGIMRPGITYNHLNLPYQVMFTKDKNTQTADGVITYIYDAAGNKLEKRVKDFHAGPNRDQEKNIVTTYLAGVEYENNSLQFIQHEEGRTRISETVQVMASCLIQPCTIYWDGHVECPPPPVCPEPGYEFLFANDYFIKDNLGSVRAILTDERHTDAYPAATMEQANVAQEKTYYSKITETSKAIASIPGYPSTDTYSNPNQYASEINGSTNKIGPGITLKVMAGDKFNLRVNSWWNSIEAEPSPAAPVGTPILDLISVLSSGIGGIPGSHSTISELQDGTILSPAINQFLQSSNPSIGNKPKAFVNWILFDEQFKFVESSSGAEPVGNKGEYKTYTRENLPVNKNGYLYVYVSNETNNIAVYFDNLQVTHIRGPLVEEAHYYPFGLPIVGISSKAVNFGGSQNKFKYNGKRLESAEFGDGSGLNLYDYNARVQDPQIGRFNMIDPHGDKYVEKSPYAYVSNNPINATDPTGMDIHLEGKAAEEAWGAMQRENANHELDGNGIEVLSEKAMNDNGGESDYNFKIQAILPVYESIIPATYAHIRDAQKVGYPYILTVAPKGTGNKARDIALAPYDFLESSREVYRDEYPFATTVEHGLFPSVRSVPAWEQRIQGNQIKVLHAAIGVGSRYFVLTVSKEDQPGTTAPAFYFVQASGKIQASESQVRRKQSSTSDQPTQPINLEPFLVPTILNILMKNMNPLKFPLLDPSLWYEPPYKSGYYPAETI